MRRFGAIRVGVALLGLLQLTGCPRWQVRACTVNAHGQCANYDRDEPDRRVRRGALGRVTTEPYAQCTHGFASVEFIEENDQEMLVRVACRLPEQTTGSGVVIPVAQPAQPAQPAPQGATP